jgi:hypothetical protein
MQKDGKKELFNSNIEIILATEMGFLSNLMEKQIRFNPKPFSKSKNLKENNDNYVDFHLDIAKKVDEVISKNEKENHLQEDQLETDIKLVEVRKNWMKGPLTPEFKTDPQGKPIFNELNINDDLFEIETPPQFRDDINDNRVDWYQDTLVPIVEKPEEEHENVLVDEEKEGSQKWLMGLGRIKVRTKNTPKKETKQEKTTKTVKHNGVTVVKKDLESAKKELEQKKKEIQEIERLAKQKEEELKKKKEERKKQEKLKIKELKKQKKLEKLKEKERKKEEKRLLEEQKKKEKQPETQVKPSETAKDYDDLIETVAKKEVIEDTKEKTPDTKTEEKEIEKPPEVKTKVTETPEVLDEDVRKALIIIDNLLEKLPEETIEEFVNSEDFAIYEKVVSKYKNK